MDNRLLEHGPRHFGLAGVPFELGPRDQRREGGVNGFVELVDVIPDAGEVGQRLERQRPPFSRRGVRTTTSVSAM